MAKHDPSRWRGSHAKREALAGRPRYLRAAVAKGIDAPASGAVQRAGGDLGAGLISGASIVTRGEAVTHEYWLDEQFITSASDAVNGSPKGRKVRFTHPGLSADGLGKFLGRMRAGRLSDDSRKAIADLHLSGAAHRTPDGDLAEYVMDMADEDPEAFGVSIVFEHDWNAEEEFLVEHGATWAEDRYGPYLNVSGFRSPDPDNVQNFPHARLKELRAADVVDDPAANPDGLFHREQQFAQEAEALAEFALGLSATPPATAALSLDPQRVRTFTERFLESHGLQINKKESDMSQGTPGEVPTGQPKHTDEPNPAEELTPDEEPRPDEEPKPGEGDEHPQPEAQADPPTGQADPPQGDDQPNPDEEPKPGEGDEPPQPEAEGDRAECGRFIQAFGPANGGQWFAEGKTFDEARDLHAEALGKRVAELQTANADLSGRLADGRGEAEAVSFQAADDSPEARRSARLCATLGPNVGRAAASMKIQRRDKDG